MPIASRALVRWPNIYRATNCANKTSIKASGVRRERQCRDDGNTVGAITCAFLLKRLANFQNSMGRTRDATSFMILACALGTTVNAAFNVISLIYAKQATSEQMFPLTLEWS